MKAAWPHPPTCRKCHGHQADIRKAEAEIRMKYEHEKRKLQAQTAVAVFVQDPKLIIIFLLLTFSFFGTRNLHFSTRNLQKSGKIKS